MSAPAWSALLRDAAARLTAVGFDRVVQAAPGHVELVRHHVIDALTPRQVQQLSDVAGAVLRRLDPEDRLGVGELDAR